MKRRLLYVFFCLAFLPVRLISQAAVAATEEATAISSVARSRSRAGQAGNFAWRSIINAQKKGTSIEEFFDAYVADLVDVSKPGYKALPPEAVNADSAEYADYYKKQGRLVPSVNTFDLAVRGEGFFAVLDTEGNTLYTRNGTFSPNDEGVLVNSDSHILEPQLVITDPNGNYIIDTQGRLFLQRQGSEPEEIYQFHLFMPAEGTEVSRHNTDFSFSQAVEVPLGPEHRILNKTLELSTTDAAKTLVRMIKFLYELKHKNSQQDYSFRMYLTDFLFKEYAHAANNPQALERFGQLAESIAPSLVFAGGQQEGAGLNTDQKEPIMIR